MNYIPYVNINMGTKSHRRRSYGNTAPLTQFPFGMSSFAIQTEVNGAWFYHPEHEFAEGVRMTHQPSPWLHEYGAFLMIPQNDVVANRGDGAWSGVRKSDTVQRPDYLKLHFLRSACTFELTPTERCAAIRMTFSDDRPSYLSLLPVLGNYTYRIDADTDTVYGTTDGHSLDDAKNFKMYFVLRFQKGTLDGERTYTVGEGGSACAHAAVKTRVVEARLGISYISEAMAALAIDRECGTLSFEEIRARAEADWEEKLHRIDIEAVDERQMRLFYSCMYRVFLYPHKAYELDENQNPVHYVDRKSVV